LSALDKVMLVSNSDAHSLPNLGREANAFDLEEINYKNIFDIIRNRDTKKFLFTIEFYPEEGKYHYDGHRDCKVRFSPAESKKHKGICPQCGKKLTLGVMNRVDKLADHNDGRKPKNFVPFKSIVPLAEILAEVFDQGVKTKKVTEVYEAMITKLGSEFEILLDISIEEIKKEFGDMIGEAINRVRQGKMIVEPGYDGEFGTVKIFSQKEKVAGKPKQKALF
jgi:DNA helicase-2/ATP-dependent DNA helicase PcrA